MGFTDFFKQSTDSNDLVGKDVFVLSNYQDKTTIFITSKDGDRDITEIDTDELNKAQCMPSVSVHNLSEISYDTEHKMKENAGREGISLLIKHAGERLDTKGIDLKIYAGERDVEAKDLDAIYNAVKERRDELLHSYVPDLSKDQIEAMKGAAKEFDGVVDKIEFALHIKQYRNDLINEMADPKHELGAVKTAVIEELNDTYGDPAAGITFSQDRVDCGASGP